MADDNHEPWFHEGLRFTCTQCGDCCTGAPGYVWVSPDEVQAIASHLGLSIEAFEEKFTRKVGARRTLIDLPEKKWDCIFLHPQTRGCTIYSVRPQQCRTWPFWDSNIKSPQTWNATCQVCPGAGKGKLYSLEAVQQQAAVVKM
jgi:Fe-S-cluster containining protein